MKSRYDHLNLGDPMTIELDVDQLARRLVRMNYGSVRMVSALVTAIRRGARDTAGNLLADRLEEVLDDLAYT